MKWESSASCADRFAGSLLGLAVGDALGAPYEGLTHADIFWQFGSPEKLVKNPSGDTRSEERRVGKECRSRWSPYH